MKLNWTPEASDDLDRVRSFLAVVNPAAAAKAIQSLVSAPNKLLEYPRLGGKLDDFHPREVRHILVDNYELRYEIEDQTIFILRVWHTREQRL